MLFFPPPPPLILFPSCLENLASLRSRLLLNVSIYLHSLTRSTFGLSRTPCAPSAALRFAIDRQHRDSTPSLHPPSQHRRSYNQRLAHHFLLVWERHQPEMGSGLTVRYGGRDKKDSGGGTTLSLVHARLWSRAPRAQKNETMSRKVVVLHAHQYVVQMNVHRNTPSLTDNYCDVEFNRSWCESFWVRSGSTGSPGSWHGCSL